jgi:hypothetical protein
MSNTEHYKHYDNGLGQILLHYVYKLVILLKLIQ